jgi:hypothetical protein
MRTRSKRAGRTALWLGAVLTVGCSPPDEGREVVVESPVLSIRFTVRDGRTMAVMSNDLWTARIVPAGDGAPESERAPARARPVDGSFAVVGPVPEGTYEVIIEAPGFLSLRLTVTFKADADNQIDAALDPLETDTGAP